VGGSRRLAMFPLSTVLFPGAVLPLHVFEPRYREMTDQCLAGDREFGVVLIARGSEVGGGDQRFGVGTVARIEAATSFDDGRFALEVVGTRRIAVDRWWPDAPYPVAEVGDLVDGPAPADGAGLARARAAVLRARTLMSELGSAAPVMAELDGGDGGGASDGAGGGAGDDDDGRLWRLCAMAPVTALDSQRLLEAAHPADRVALLGDLCEALAGDLSALLGRGPG
jgi:Lon protease-like protein